MRLIGKRVRVCVALFLLLPAALSGCSWYVVKGPPSERSRSLVVECTDGYEIPVLDTALGALALLLASSGIYTVKNGNNTGMVALILGLGGAGLAGWSAYGGYTAVSACREAKAGRDQTRLSGGMPPLTRSERTPSGSGSLRPSSDR